MPQDRPPPIKIQEIYANKESGRLYKVVAVTPLSVGYIRATDLKSYINTVEKFRESFRLAEPAEKKQALKFLAKHEAKEIKSSSEKVAERLTPPKTADGQSGKSGGKFGTVIELSELDNLDRLIVSDSVRSRLMTAFNAVLRRDALISRWHLDKIAPVPRRQVLNFYGKPGTGKTLAARALARAANLPLFQVNYAKTLGNGIAHESNFRIQGIFEEAKKLGAVLFIDEADTLTLDRARSGLNGFMDEERNVFMQAMDGFEGVLIMTTNRLDAFDPAILRRITRHILFELPDAEQRAEIFKVHLNPTGASFDYNALATASVDLSGGDILAACVDAIEMASLPPDEADWKLTTDKVISAVHLLRQSRMDAGRL